MEGGMAGHGMSASYQPAEKSKTKQNFLKTSKKRASVCTGLRLGGFQEVFVRLWGFWVEDSQSKQAEKGAVKK